MLLIFHWSHRVIIDLISIFSKPLPIVIRKKYKKNSSHFGNRLHSSLHVLIFTAAPTYWPQICSAVVIHNFVYFIAYFSAKQNQQLCSVVKAFETSAESVTNYRQIKTLLNYNNFCLIMHSYVFKFFSGIWLTTKV